MSLFESESAERQPESKKPRLAELFQSPRFGEQIARSIARTRTDHRERTFLAAYSQKEGVLVNRPLRGKVHKARTHFLGLGREFIHAQGTGHHLPEGFHPYLFFHTHSVESPDPSVRDLLYLYSIARQNYLLASKESDWWLNPVGATAGRRGDMIYYQFPAEVVAQTQYSETILDRLGEATIEVGRRLKVKEAIEGAVELEYTAGEILFNIVDGQPYYEFPTFVHNHLDEVYREAEIKFERDKWTNQADLVSQISNFDLTPDFED